MNKAAEKSLRHFDETAGDYDNSSDGKFTQKMYESLLAEIDLPLTGRLLDVGCGTGNVLAKLQESRLELYGLDLSPAMIDRAKERLGERVGLSVADAEEMPFADNYFDLLICNASFHHYPHPEKVMAEMHRIMKPGAWLLIGESYIMQPWRFLMNIGIRFSPDGDFHIYGQKEMIRLLEKHDFALTKAVKIGEHVIIYKAQAK